MVGVKDYPGKLLETTLICYFFTALGIDLF